MNIPQLNRDEWLQKLSERLSQTPSPCHAMYSSFAGGIVTDPSAMMVPVDDHLVHRGDGVFETLKSVNGAVYNMAAHLDRLTVSALGIALQPRHDAATLRELILATLQASRLQDAQIRVLLSRGPGSMGVNPHDTVGSETYIVVSGPVQPFMSRKPTGAAIGFTRIPAKPPPFAALKHCNYLPNALMANEAQERGLDFVISLNAQDELLEGPTENIAVVTAGGELITPDTPTVLPGTTLERVLTLASTLVANGTLNGIRYDAIPRSTLEHAREVLITGTSHDVIAVTQINAIPVGDGQPGPVFRALSDALMNDIRTNATLRTVYAT
jgi:branched-subunit amino acid aminotransferase/4-amino-4-deoxychorismate lyase